MKPTGNLIVDGMVQIVTAHVGQNPIDASKLPGLMKDISTTLIDCLQTATAALGGSESSTQTSNVLPTPRVAAAAPAVAAPAVAAAPQVSEPEVAAEEEKAPAVDPRRQNLPTEPAVPIKDSIRQNGIVCLFDGEERKMLSRHLSARYSMTPEEYRAYWKLPDDYPMTAPGYSAEKRLVAVSQGLGSYRKKKGAKKAAAKKKTRKSA